MLIGNAILRSYLKRTRLEVEDHGLGKVTPVQAMKQPVPVLIRGWVPACGCMSKTVQSRRL